MATLTIRLVPFNQTFTLPKEWIRQALPTSILASALEDDLDVTTLDINQPEVTPDVMTFLVDLAARREPSKHIPHLVLADRYLNIPSTLHYAYPFYDQIPNRQNGAAPENKEFIEAAIRNDLVLALSYLVAKGYIPTNQDLVNAVHANAINVVRLLLATPGIDPTFDRNQALHSAASIGNTAMVALLLADPRVDPRVERRGYSVVDVATSFNHLDTLKLILADPRLNLVSDDSIELDNILWSASGDGYQDIVEFLISTYSSYGHRINIALERAAGNGHLGIVKFLWEQPGIDYVGAYWALAFAARDGHADVVEFLLAQPQIDPTATNNIAIRYAAEAGKWNMVDRLLEDPRIHENLPPELVVNFYQRVPYNITY